MALGMEVSLGPGHIVIDGDPAPVSIKMPEPPPRQFSAHFYFGQTAEWIRMPLGMEVGLIPGVFVLHGEQLPFPKVGGATQFSAYIYRGQTAVCIGIPLGTQVGLSL